MSLSQARGVFLIHCGLAKSELSGTALRCMCSLLTEATHFNYRVNLMSAIVADLSKKSWDEVFSFMILSHIAS
jgi:nucleolar complex protein 3